MLYRSSRVVIEDVMSYDGSDDKSGSGTFLSLSLVL